MPSVSAWRFKLPLTTSNTDRKGVDIDAPDPHIWFIAGTNRRQRLRDASAPARLEHRHAVPTKSSWF